MFLIYISDKKNKTNKWCAISGILLSLGTLKEYLYFDLYPNIAESFNLAISMNIITGAYSFMTGILYYLAMPSIVIFSLYFSSYPTVHSKRFKYIRVLIFCPAIILSIIFSPLKISYYQHNNYSFWYTVTTYNLIYGIIMLFLMLRAVYNEKIPKQRQQKKLPCLVVLPAVWYWLITIFVFHSLKLTPFFKVWKINIITIVIVIMFYVIAAFKEGIMGMKLKKENYHWDSGMETVNNGAQYTNHILKNEVTKIEWCVSNLSQKYPQSMPEELSIIKRSTQHLKYFVEKNKLYSNNIILKMENVLIHDIINASMLSVKEYIGSKVILNVYCNKDSYMICDKEHVLEVLNNLISNAADAMDKDGTIIITHTNDKQGYFDILSVADEGHGIPKEHVERLFEPYFTTKKTNSNFGLGLAYCTNVMKKHGGYVDIKSEEGRGTIVYLYFPYKNDNLYRGGLWKIGK